MLIVDRIEGELAVCERQDRTMAVIPLAELPPGLREGDCLRETGDGYAVDAEETARRRARNRDRFRGLLEDGD